MSLLYFFKWSRVFNFALITLLFCQIYPAFAFDPESLLEEKDLSSGTTPHPLRDIFIGMPEDIFLVTFSYFSILGLCKLTEVCKDWKKVANDERLWKLHKNRIYGSFPDNDLGKITLKVVSKPVRKSSRIKKQKTIESEDGEFQQRTSKEKVKIFLLRVLANAKTDPKQAEELIEKYSLNQGYINPYISLVVKIFENWKKLVPTPRADDKFTQHDFIEILVAHGHPSALNLKRLGLADGIFGYDKNVNEVTKSTSVKKFLIGGELIEPFQNFFFDDLIKSIISSDKTEQEKQNIHLISNNLSNLICGKKNTEELNSYIGELVGKNIYVGHYLKSLGLKFDLFGFDKNPEAAKEYILENNVSY